MKVSVKVSRVVEDYTIRQDTYSELVRWIKTETHVYHDYKRHQIYDQSADYYPPATHADFCKLVGTETSYDEFNAIAKNANRAMSINPTLEFECALENITKPEHLPKYAAGVLVMCGEVIIASILVIVDPRTTWKKECAGFFIGIRKSSAMFAAQQYLEGTEHPLLKIRVVNLIVPAVMEYARQCGAKYAVTIPLLNMSDILKERFKFNSSLNGLFHKPDYDPAVYLMKCFEEMIYWHPL